MKTNSKSYTHVFEAKLFNCANSYVAGSRYVTEIDTASDKKETIMSQATGQSHR